MFNTKSKPFLFNTYLIFNFFGFWTFFGCGNKSVDNKNIYHPNSLTAFIADSNTLGIKEFSEEVEVNQGYFQSTLSIHSELTRIDKSGEIVPVLSEKREAHHILKLPHSILVSGAFESVFIADKNQYVNCYLISFPISSKKEPVKCLSQTPIGSYSIQDSIHSQYNKFGFSVRAANVYFVDGKHLKTWNEETQKTEVLLTSKGGAGNAMVDVYLSSSTQRICVLYPLRNGVNGKLLCSSPSDSVSNSVPASYLWKTVDFGRHKVTSDTFQLSSELVVTSKHALSLLDLSIRIKSLGPKVEYTLAGRDQTLLTSDGGAISIGHQGSLIRVLPTGDLAPIDSSMTWEGLTKGRSHVWAHAESILKRITLDTYTLESENYFGNHATVLHSLGLETPSLSHVIQIDGNVL